MASDELDPSAAERATARFAEFLEFLSEEGHSQTQIAAKAALPPQYLSDIKRGRRPVTELVARRMGEAFGVNYLWLLGVSEERETSAAVGEASGPRQLLALPVFSHPVEGEPRTHPQWEGTVLELAGPAVAKAACCKQPYILRFGHTDSEGRIRKGDLVLISQAPSQEAEIVVVRSKGRSYLARPMADGTFLRLAKPQNLPAEAVVTGHAVGIVWGSLLER